MWAYSMAAAHLNLEHTIVDHHMVSTWGGAGEGFPFIDTWNSMHCRAPQGDASPTQKVPTFIHLASNFKAPRSKQWMFHKGHVPADILHCGVPLLKESPDNLWNVIPKAQTPTKRSAWILCNTVSRVNQVRIARRGPHSVFLVPPLPGSSLAFFLLFFFHRSPRPCPRPRRSPPCTRTDFARAESTSTGRR